MLGDVKTPFSAGVNRFIQKAQNLFDFVLFYINYFKNYNNMLEMLQNVL